ncbi:adenylyl-sulfate kinase [Candidatus Woesearchaeota archaeon]|mgnify:CR=1 FL=1|jgi:cytidine diphosphoramidate kinase|nr:adenylyl-sulfate kinase [Candidatus Woesearchaeota archaeon]MBT5397228.1 adenylyl-sulfate kinase [Candidatus Woesearchaeota archaeon]MBT5924864.1 adenylyl-sulfate kinase [Candidatus Woesearchaeota archaeon]MBT6367226.1 adenylyl-sulfate kinase [Candidatus Woesearchaeota archaeon]MBT7762628.1 adenylyl-sulfate kinase [Candidatus Woesearchaeota archaeon]
MIIWITGMSASGKTAIANELYPLLKNKHKHTILLDGDVFRDMHKNDVDHSMEGRKKNGDRICQMCKFLDKQEINVICASLAPFHEIREWNKANYNKYFEVFLDVPLNVLVQRDPKGLYKMALNGEMKNMVGIDLPFPPPRNPDLVINNIGDRTPKSIAEEIFSTVEPNLEN